MEAIQEFLNNILPLVRLTAIFLGAYAVLLWAASVLWAYRDIRRRTEDVSVQVLAVGIVSLLPFLGIPLHLILRPPETLAEKYERTLEEEFLRRDLEEQFVCPECQRPIEPDFILCPHCHTQLRRHCEACRRVIDLTWRICPYCGHRQAGNAPTVRADGYPVAPPVEVRQ
ncbi:MAG: zinc ribbon domain-containing protein [Chloroflexus sp.]|jgi:RNA polymerase subunit RPABC4/transcription elongation factor Spt4|nr:zinc ribbon domain-containing protein [Chloroflexus sp.]MBO9317723.1 zinc ribbon domain-containing protein [Chloroflexus sp.]MBO9338221.1 zinc ribbon domain-containing protein [Chloroflexus sp.]MBO9374049.1 zinc ribbon domain-containing protein [Chloroflexus sp.]